MVLITKGCSCKIKSPKDVLSKLESALPPTVIAIETYRLPAILTHSPASLQTKRKSVKPRVKQ